MMTLPRGEDISTWYERVGKALTPIATVLVILAVPGTFILWENGGFLPGNQVVADKQAQALVAMKSDIADTKADISDIKKTLSSLPLTMQQIADQARHLTDIDSDIRSMGDRQTSDERKYDAAIADTKARMDGFGDRINGLYNVPVRQPQR